MGVIDDFSKISWTDKVTYRGTITKIVTEKQRDKVTHRRTLLLRRRTKIIRRN